MQTINEEYQLSKLQIIVNNLKNVFDCETLKRD